MKMEQVIFKKSPVIILKNFLALEIAAVGLFLFAGSLAYYAKIYRSIFIAHFIPFQVAQIIFIFTCQTALMAYIFVAWHRETFTVRSGRLVHAKGILYRRRMTIPLEQVYSISYRQAPLGKLLKYGIVELHMIGIPKPVLIADIADPQECGEVILKFKRLELPRDNLTDSPSPNIHALIAQPEREDLEFKTTFRWDVRDRKVNRNLEKTAMKTIAAFLNSQGGHLVLGVDDSRSVIGLKDDFDTLGRPDADGFENHFSHVFQNAIGAEYRHHVTLTYAVIGDKPCCVVRVAPGSQPAYLRWDGQEEFYIRTGNGTTSLKFSQAAAYIDSRFKK